MENCPSFLAFAAARLTQILRRAASCSGRFQNPQAAPAVTLTGVFAAGALLALFTGWLGPAAALAQTGSAPPEIQFQKSLGGSGDDYGYSVQQTADGGYIAIGETSSNNGDAKGNRGSSDMWVVKLSESGGVVWQKSLGGSKHDRGLSVQQTADGGYIAIGDTYSNNGDVKGNRGLCDMWVTKLSESGEIVWQKSLGGSDSDGGADIQHTADGGYIAIGHTYSKDGDVKGYHNSGKYQADMWVTKLSESGNLEWQKTLGGSETEYGRSIQQTSDGGYIAAGFSHSNDGDASGNRGNSDMWVVKLTGGGNLEWQKSLGGSGKDEAFSVKQTSDGGYIAAGVCGSNDGDVSGNHGGLDFCVVKLSEDGNLEWQKSLGGSKGDAAMSVWQTADGGFIAAGSSDSNDGDASGNHGGADIWLTKLSPGGSLEWQKSAGGGGNDWANSVQQTADGGCVTAGMNTSNGGDVSGNHGDADVWVVKFGPPARPMVSPVW
jgi:hypothetical protein